MKSPFPGMDPYLEQHWCDVHSRLIMYSCDRLQQRLPGNLRARVEERVFLEADDDSYRVIYPDVHVFEQSEGRDPAPTAAAETNIALQKPLLVHLDDEPIRQGFIEIVDAASGNRVVTIIEFLSPSNKIPGEGRRWYLRKVREVAQAGATVVEIDLTREGRRALMLPTARIPRSYRTTYQACARRSWKPSAYEIYRAPCASLFPPSAFLCGRRTPTCRWNCRPWWTSATRTGGTTRWTTASRPNRRWIRPTPPGPMNCCGPRDDGSRRVAQAVGWDKRSAVPP